jgi:hypothetical protein
MEAVPSSFAHPPAKARSILLSACEDEAISLLPEEASMLTTEYFSKNEITVTRRDLDKDAIGTTGYIDSLYADDFESGTIYHGQDPHGREYVAIKVRKGLIKHCETMLVAFQRYAKGGYNDVWVTDTPKNHGSLESVLDELMALRALKHWEFGGCHFEAL